MYLENLVGGDGVMKMTTNNVWEIVDNDFVEIACATCANNFLAERGIQHELGKNYTDEASGIYAHEDVYGEHDFGHKCLCGLVLG